MGATLLVTGGAGFIGSNFVRHILNSTDYEIVVLDLLTYAGNLANLADVASDFPGRYRFYQGDIADFELLDSLFSKLKPSDVIVNFAAHTHNDNSLINPQPFIDTNIVGTYRILEAVRKYDLRLHHISTDEVFGDLGLNSAEEFVENSRYQPSSPYSASKAAADHLVRAWVRSFKIKATISNCSNNFGPYQHVEKFIPRQITQLLTAKVPILYGTGENVRDWIHVDDHSRAVQMIIERGKLGHTYLISARQTYSNLQILKLLLQLFDLPENHFKSVPDRPGHDQRYAINPSKLEALGFRAQHTNMLEALAATVSWYRENPKWWEEQKALTEAHYALREDGPKKN